ncbi:hypothetical protein [Paenibacillus jiagnxiensis]|uniref:hypothetical protein n=1 Tax=Paenibacillus jiagnxiensis TaxID=3228926 RepID=UPI0033AD2AAC
MTKNVEVTLKPVCIVLGPYDEDELGYNLTRGFLVDDHHVMYIAEGYLWLRKVNQAAKHNGLYIDDPSAAGLILASNVTQIDDDFLVKVHNKLTTMNALGFLISELHTLVSNDIFFNVKPNESINLHMEELRSL